MEGLRCEVLSREAAKAQLPLMQSREGWQVADLLRCRRGQLRSVAALRRWIARRSRNEAGNPYWDDLHAAVADLQDSTTTLRLPAAALIPETKRGHNATGKSCPMPSITSSVAPRILAANSCPAATGTSGSSLPWMT